MANFEKLVSVHLFCQEQDCAMHEMYSVMTKDLISASTLHYNIFTIKEFILGSVL